MVLNADLALIQTVINYVKTYLLRLNKKRTPASFATRLATGCRVTLKRRALLRPLYQEINRGR